MSKLHHRKFARFFPSYHPRSGEPTYFVEKIHWGITNQIFQKWEHASHMIWDLNKHLPNKEIVQAFIDGLDDETDLSNDVKSHTIRAGHHVKPGDFIRPSVWSGKPYKSKQIIIGPDIEVVKVWDFKIHEYKEGFWIDIGSNSIHPMEDFKRSILPMVAANDGLEMDDFLHWFKYPKSSGPMQIICWNKDVNY